MNKFYSEASEKGKTIVNKCIELGYEIDTVKLEKILILIHGIMLSKYNKPFFKEMVISTKYGPIIKEVDEELRIYAGGFKETLYAPIAILSYEEEIIDEVLLKYCTFDVFKLNKVPQLILINKYSNNTVSNKIIQCIFDYYKFDSNKSLEEGNIFIKRLVNAKMV